MIESSAKHILVVRRWFLPLALVPYAKGSHTANLLGWQGRRPRWIKDVKAAFNFSTARLNDDHLRIETFFPWRWLVLEIAREDIVGADINAQDAGVVDIRFRDALRGRYYRMASAGGDVVRDRVMLNIGDEAADWVAAIRGERTARLRADDSASCAGSP